MTYRSEETSPTQMGHVVNLTAFFLADEVTTSGAGMDVRGAGWVFFVVPDLPCVVEITFGAILHAERVSAPELILLTYWVEDAERRPLPESRFSELLLWPEQEVVAGAPVDLSLSTQVPFTATRPGRHWLVLDVQGATGGPRALPFAVRTAA